MDLDVAMRFMKILIGETHLQNFNFFPLGFFFVTHNITGNLTRFNTKYQMFNPNSIKMKSNGIKIATNF